MWTLGYVSNSSILSTVVKYFALESGQNSSKTYYIDNQNSSNVNITTKSNIATSFTSCYLPSFSIISLSTPLSGEPYQLAYDSCTNSVLLMSDNMCNSGNIICNWNFNT